MQSRLCVVPASAELEPVELTPAEAELEAAVLEGYTDLLSAVGCTDASIKRALRNVLRFATYAQRPMWRWQPRQMDRYGAHIRRAGNGRSWIRASQGDVKRFLDYASNPAYPWDGRCVALTGFHFHQICTPENMLAHQYGAESSDRRNLTAEERRIFFGGVRAAIADADAREGKGWLTTRRDFALFHFMLAFGPREQETAMADLGDLPAAVTPEVRAFSPFEHLHIRFGKRPRRKGYKQRTVPAIPLFRTSLQHVAWYLREVRPKLARPDSPPAIFLGERGERLRPDTISALFAKYRADLELDQTLTLYCVRHSFATLLHEHGVETPVIAKLMGHERDSTTQIYAHITEDFVRQRLRTHHARMLSEAFRRHAAA